MPSYALYMGGLAGNTDNRMVPQNSPCEVTGYADHQRRRSYSVTRQLDFRPRVPYGGLDVPVDQKDYDWYQALLATGTDIVVGDFLNLIIIPPYTRLEWVEANIVIPRTGLTLQIIQRSNACPGSPAEATVTLSTATNSPLDDADLGDTAGIYFSQRLDSSLLETSLISFEVIAVPGSGDALAGLFAIVQAEVVDWGSYDFNGNA